MEYNIGQIHVSRTYLLLCRDSIFFVCVEFACSKAGETPKASNEGAIMSTSGRPMSDKEGEFVVCVGYFLLTASHCKSTVVLCDLC